MRPSRTVTVTSERGFLRSRGDAPNASHVHGTAVVVPPLTRRCARSDARRCGAPGGSSAHAEMRPRSTSTPRVSFGFLRSRGDAPHRRSSRPRARAVPPLTRRCAPRADARAVVLGGSSAHAEMRPRVMAFCCVFRRFLRSRGDAPGARTRQDDRSGVPPLTRRCANTRGEGRPACSGSSAHAEMRPFHARGALVRVRFLRSRGDAPAAAAACSSSSVVPPLTRRCAPKTHRRRAVGSGSSAHAEMRPCEEIDAELAVRFLRSRGDAPAGRGDRSGRIRVPPLTRRCAPRPPALPCAPRGSSAHAEMRRRRCTSASGVTGFLRSRGDAPGTGSLVTVTEGVPPLTRRCARERAVEESSGKGSSAHAEMRPRPLLPRRRAPRFLRSRGDAPAAKHVSAAVGSVPPLTRRCALGGSRVVVPYTGSSAHAEMRPRCRRTRRTEGRFLRSRGDAPFGIEMHSILEGSPSLASS